MNAIMKTNTEKVVKDAEGKVLSVETRTDTQAIKKNEENEYVKMYTDKILDLIDDKLSNKQFKFIILLTKYVGYADVNDLNGGMIIKLDTRTKKEIQNKLGIQESYFYKTIKELKKKRLIKKIDKGYYQLNPFFFGKGYYEYRPSYKQGGIKDIRDTWDLDITEKAKKVENNINFIEYLKNDEDFCNGPMPSENEYAVRHDFTGNIKPDESILPDEDLESFEDIIPADYDY